MSERILLAAPTTPLILLSCALAIAAPALLTHQAVWRSDEGEIIPIILLGKLIVLIAATNLSFMISIRSRHFMSWFIVLTPVVVYGTFCYLAYGIFGLRIIAFTTYSEFHITIMALNIACMAIAGLVLYVIIRNIMDKEVNFDYRIRAFLHSQILHVLALSSLAMLWMRGDFDTFGNRTIRIHNELVSGTFHYPILIDHPLDPQRNYPARGYDFSSNNNADQKVQLLCDALRRDAFVLLSYRDVSGQETVRQGLPMEVGRTTDGTFFIIMYQTAGQSNTRLPGVRRLRLADITAMNVALQTAPNDKRNLVPPTRQRLAASTCLRS